ncbi:MAG TPA: hypothetical protein VG433_12910 [Pirellulales bacterium]|jgi:hypothetical protein|nr:hypothetical protein [Pirellulales bacterium]
MILIPAGLIFLFCVFLLTRYIGGTIESVIGWSCLLAVGCYAAMRLIRKYTEPKPPGPPAALVLLLCLIIAGCACPHCGRNFLDAPPPPPMAQAPVEPPAAVDRSGFEAPTSDEYRLNLRARARH